MLQTEFQLPKFNQEWMDAHKPIDIHLESCTICDDLRSEVLCSDIEPMFIALEAANDRRNHAINAYHRKKKENENPT